MMQSDGALSLRRSSNRFLGSIDFAWWEALLLLGGGALAVVLHQTTRFPMGLPGRHGLEWMAILLVGRASSRSRYAGSLVGTGAAAFSLLPLWGVGHDPFLWLLYLVPGLLIDIAYSEPPSWRASLWLLPLVAGLAFATKPLIRWVISLLTGLPYGSLLMGLGYPLLTHFLFGLLGGVLGALAVMGARKIKAKI